MPIGILCSLPVGARMLATRHRAASALFRPLRMLCTDGKKAVTTTEDPGDAVAEPLKNERGEVRNAAQDSSLSFTLLSLPRSCRLRRW